VVASYAFELPLVLTGFALSETSALNKVVVVEALKPKLVLSESHLDFEDRIMLSERVKAVPYTTVVTFTNNDTEALEWVLGKPVDMLPEGAKNIFKIEPKEGRLMPNESVEVRMTFLPRQPEKYSVAVPLYLRPDTEQEYLSIKMEGNGTRPRMAFDVMGLEMPIVPLGVTSTARFTIYNHGYDNLELSVRLPADALKMPITLEWPEGKIIGLAKQALPVIVSFVSASPLSFTGDVELIDEDGIRFALPITGMTDNCVLTSYPFLAANEELGDDMTVAEGQPLSLQIPETEMQVWQMPTPLWNLEEWPTKSLMRWINVTDPRAVLVDLVPSMVQSRGTKLIDLIEFLSGKKCPGKVVKLSANKKDQVAQMMGQYEEVMAHLKTFGALLNDVMPELLLDLEDFRRLLYSKEQAVQLAAAGSAEADALPHWQAMEAQHTTLATGAWCKIIYQVIRCFALSRITPKSFKSLPGVDPDQTGADATLAQSNIYSVSEAILLKWMTSHFFKALPNQAHRVTNFDTDMASGLVLYALLVSHWPSLDSYYGKMHKPPKTTRQSEENARLVVEMMKSLQLAWEPTPEAEELMYPNAREMLMFVLYLYSTLPQLIPKTTIEFSGLLGEEQCKTIELTNPSPKEISYSVRLEGSRMFTPGDVLVRLPPKSKQEFEIRCLPRTSRAIYGRIMLTSRKEAGVAAATVVFGLHCQVSGAAVECQLTSATSLTLRGVSWR
jgi:hypothetical protein